MPEEERFSAISMGSWIFCALRQNGTPTCWHWDMVADSWVRANKDPDVGEIVSISTGGLHGCGLQETWEAVCWHVSGHRHPEPVPSENALFVAIASETFHTCGLGADGSRLCRLANRIE